MHRERHRVAQAAREDLVLRALPLPAAAPGKSRRRGGVNIHTAPSGAVPSPAWHGRVSLFVVGAGIGGRADIDEDAAGAVEHEMLQRMGIVLEPGSTASTGCAPGSPE